MLDSMTLAAMPGPRSGFEGAAAVKVPRLSRPIVERAQRARMRLDLAWVNLEAAESTLGAQHPATTQVRRVLSNASAAWGQLFDELGPGQMDEALDADPALAVPLDPRRPGQAPDFLLVIQARTYRAEALVGTAEAPAIWRLRQLIPEPGHQGPYHACRLADGTGQCDCPAWIYRIQGIAPAPAHCKHLRALASLGWI